MQCDASIQYRGKIREERFFSAASRLREREKKVGPKEKGGRGMREREKRQGACTNHVLERLARALSMPL